ncbi:MAG: oligosaccharide flippase family protein, partial [Planctomycetes bacterium]|nr:oligosaccharide flippase family protein [Planctomycetota bacterium]
ALALFGPWTMVVRLGLATTSALVLLGYYHGFLVAVLKANEAFGILTKATYLQVTATFATTLPLMYFLRMYGLSVYGLYASVVISFLITIGYLRLSFPFQRGQVFRWPVLWGLLKKGFPIVIINMSVMLITTCDRIIVGSLLGKTAVGYYGIAALTVALLINIPGTAREVLTPRLMRAVESTPQDELVSRYLLGPLLNTAYLMPFLVGPVFFALPVGIRLLLPRYWQGIVAAQTLTLGVYFLALAYVPYMLIVAKNWQFQASWRLPPILVFNVVLGIVLVGQGYGLFGVALSTALSFVLLAVVLTGFLWSKLRLGAARRRRYLFALAAPVVVIYLLINCLSLTVRRFVPDVYAGAALSIGIYCGVLWLLYRAASARLALLKTFRLRDFV